MITIPMWIGAGIALFVVAVLFANLPDLCKWVMERGIAARWKIERAKRGNK